MSHVSVQTKLDRFFTPALLRSKTCAASESSIIEYMYWLLSIYLSIYLSISRWDSLDGDQPDAKPLSTRRTTQAHSKRTQTSVPLVGFEPTVSVFERGKTAWTL
jgi:hypothetical protein